MVREMLDELGGRRAWCWRTAVTKSEADAMAAIVLQRSFLNKARAHTRTHAHTRIHTHTHTHAHTHHRSAASHRGSRGVPAARPRPLRARRTCARARARANRYTEQHAESRRVPPRPAHVLSLQAGGSHSPPLGISLAPSRPPPPPPAAGAPPGPGPQPLRHRDPLPGPRRRRVRLRQGDYIYISL